MAWVNLNTIYATKSEVNSKVPNTRTINGKALSSNVTLGASDIKLSDDTTLQSAWDSISQLLSTKTFSFNASNVTWGTTIEKQVNIARTGYTPVAIVGVQTNHNGSFCITEFRLNSSTTAYIACMNLNPAKGTWTSVTFSFNVLYQKNS